MKNFLQIIKILTLALILSAGVNYLYAQQDYRGPQGSPNTQNTPTPLNVSSVAQSKIGGLAVDTLVVNGLSHFFGNFRIQGGGTASVSGDVNVQANVQVGPSSVTQPAAQSTFYDTVTLKGEVHVLNDVLVTGGLTVLDGGGFIQSIGEGNVKIDSLAHTTGGTVSEDMVCIGASGRLILCN